MTARAVRIFQTRLSEQQHTLAEPPKLPLNVVPADGAEPDPEELRAHVRKTLRGSRTPDRVVFRDELPTTPTGKVLRRELVAQLRSDQVTT